MYSLFSLPFVFFFLFGFVALFFSFYLPGSFFLLRLKLKSAPLFFLLACVSGLVLWSVQGVVFGYLHLRWLSYLYLLFFAVTGTTNLKHHFIFLRKLFESIRAHRSLVLFLFVGIILQCLAMLGSGLLFPKGVEFFQTNAVDGILHLSYIESIAKTFPPKEPGSYILDLQNYHYWSDVNMAELYRVWHIPPTILFFQLMPIVLSLWTGIAAYLIIRIWRGSHLAGMWSLFLLFFGGDAAYLFMLAIHRTLNFSTPAIDNGATQFLNMPHVFAKLILLAGLIPLTFLIRTRQKRWMLLTILFFGPLVGFKVYFGLFVAIGLAVLAIGKLFVSFFQKPHTSFVPRILAALRKDITIYVCVAAVAAIMLAVYIPVNKGSGGLFYSPLEWPKIFMGPDGLNFRTWWLRGQVYEAHNNTRGLILLNTFAILVCLICIYGTRLFGFWPNLKAYRTIERPLLLFCVPGIFLFTFLGLYTLQVSGLFNVFNFFAVAIVPLSLLSAFTLEQMQRSKSIANRLFLIVFVLLTIPRVIHDGGNFVVEYATNAYQRQITPQEIAALTFIKDHTPSDSIVQSHPANDVDQQTPYVSFFTDRSTYLSGWRLLETHNQPIDDQKAMMKRVSEAHNSPELATLLKGLQVSYFYVQKRPEQVYTFSLQAADFKKVFENDAAIVYQVE